MGSIVVVQLVKHLVIKRLPETWIWLTAVDTLIDLAMVGLAIFILVHIIMDVRAQSRQISRNLQITQARLAGILDSAMDAIITVDAEQRIVLFNRAAEQVFRCHRDLALGTALERFIPARFHAAHRHHVEKFGETRITGRRMGDTTVLWARRPDNDEEFPIEASISHSSEDGATFFTVILRDVSERRRHEEEIKRHEHERQALTAQIHEARDDEKSRIARELHDELGQLLTALKMDLTMLRGRLPAGDAPAAASASRMNDTLEQSIASVRRISTNLGPLMLDDLGFSDAAAWLAEDFSERFGIPCDLDMPAEHRLADLDHGRVNALYRILQEALTNIARHAQARNTWIRVAIEGGQLRMDVEDDGRGIASDDLSKTRTLGVRGMRERINLVGGNFDIGRASQGGTRVSVQIPLEPLSQGGSP